jgi:hypothetical protein
MKANREFANLPKSFWGSVRSVSQKVGYSIRGQNLVKVPTIIEIGQAFEDLHLDPSAIVKDGEETQLAKQLTAYFEYRADILNTYVEPRLMNVERAKNEYQKLYNTLKPTCPIPMNKQKGDKQKIAYLTAIINILVEKHSQKWPCDYDPRQLTTITKDGSPVRTLTRRWDGAVPSPVNPIAIWEIKEYYYTTTFGSRISDGVYTSLLDGMELKELYENERIEVLHYLMVDAYDTWWGKGKSYLCRLVDMINMGYVDEVLFGYEVIERLPKLVRQWQAREQNK